MAIGDLVNGLSDSNVILDFQPAAGVECIITAIACQDTAVLFRMRDGSTESVLTNDGTNYALPDTNNMKILIENGMFLRIDAVAAAITGFLGIQIG